MERRDRPQNGIEDYFSTTAEMRAQTEPARQGAEKLTDELEADVADFTTREISTVEDTYAVKSQYQAITSRLPLLDDGDLRARLLDQVENRYDYFEGIMGQMSDTIALYEKQKAIDAAKAQEKAMKDAEEQRRQAEKDTRKNEFLQALQTVEALEYQQPNAQALVQDAIAKLPLVGRGTRSSRPWRTGSRTPSAGSAPCLPRMSGLRPRPRSRPLRNRPNRKRSSRPKSSRTSSAPPWIGKNLNGTIWNTTDREGGQKMTNKKNSILKIASRPRRLKDRSGDMEESRDKGLNEGYACRPAPGSSPSCA